MAVLRDDPYGGFCFTVGLGDRDPAAASAGFTEVSGLERRLTVLRYRAGNDPGLAPRLLPGLAAPVEVRLSRGVIGDLALHQWLEAGLGGAVERRDVVIALLSEDRATVAQRWRLRRAWPVAMLGPTLDALAGTVAVETLVLAAEALETD